MEELKMTRYAKDTAAAAVVLADYGETSIEYHTAKAAFVLRFERIRRVKILTKDGYDWGNFSISLYHDGNTEEDLSTIKAVTYNLENGKSVETKLKNDAIFREETDQNWKTVKFALPNVKVGSVIEIAYKVSSPFLFQFQGWDFQSTIPVQWSEYRAHIPEYFEYKKLMQGYLAMTVNETEQQHKSLTVEYREKMSGGSNRSASTLEQEKIEFVENYFRWVVKDSPAFREESRMTTYRDYISTLNFELHSVQMPGQAIQYFNKSWVGLGNDFLDNSSFGGVVKGSGFLKEHVEKATAGKTDPKEKIGAIYSYVKENMGWDGRYRVYATENLKRSMEEKKGSSADINLTLVSMLQKAGLTAFPFLVSTRNHGFIRKDYPLGSQFNYVIAAVELDGKYVLLDATDRSLPSSILPERCLNGEGLLVKMDQSSWIKINAIKSRMAASTDLVVGSSADIKGKIQFTYDGYYGQNMRKKFLKEGKAEYLKELASSHAWEISSGEYENMEKLSEPVKEVLELQVNDYIQATGDHMYINPLVIMRLQENPFQAEQRQYPVDFGSPEENTYVARITLPQDWTVEELPKPKVIVLPGNSAKCVYSITQSGNIISVTSQVIINKALFAPEEYPGLRDFYAQVVAKHAEQIVLKKN